MKKIYLLFTAILFTNCSQNQNYLLEEGVVDIDYLKNSSSDIVVGVRKFDEISHFSKTKIFLQKLGTKVVRVVSGQKIVLDQADKVKVYATASTVDVIASILEGVT